MAASGRPTPQPERTERPRFQDRLPEDYRRGDINPYVTSHRTFGRPLLPASEAWTYRGQWERAFGRTAPLHVEIGSGNGFFLRDLARRNPQWNLLGVEIRYKRVVQTATKLVKADVTNALIARYNAYYLDDLFADGEIARLYVNHPDPWPKARHDKHRLISRWFLEEVCRLLPPGGELRLKSDFRPNIDRVGELLDRGPDGEPRPPLPLAIAGTADDVTTGPAPWPDDIETNYQSKFRKRGLPVYALRVVRTEGSVQAS